MSCPRLTVMSLLSPRSNLADSVRAIRSSMSVAGTVWVGRAKDRHGGDDAGVFDQIADAHDVAADSRFGLQPWRIWSLRDGRRREGAERNKCSKDHTYHRETSAHHVGGGRQHLVGCGNNFCIHFVRTLRGDQVRNFTDRFNVCLFEEALLEVAESIRVWIAVLWRARSWRLEVHVVADALKPGFVDKDREFELPDLARCVRAWLRYEHLTLRVNGDRHCVLRNGDARLD